MVSDQCDNQKQMTSMLRVRQSIWGILLAAILVAIAIPATHLWHASSVALHAHVYLSPAAPRAGEPAQLIVVLADPTDRAAVHGPWAKAVARWDMWSMTMGAQQRAVPGIGTTSEELTIPICLDMPGDWWAQIVIQTPGRPEWRSSLQFNVQPPSSLAVSTIATPTTTQATGQRSGCV